ncbi:MAG TPA: alpha/beta hydrolase [bacterium]|nr:alpha/beta hydrolase [bacterium]
MNRVRISRRLQAVAILLLFAAVLAAPAAAERAFTPAPYYSPEQWLTIGGAKICYLDEGQGEAMVLVHGWAGNAWNWESVFGPLSEHHRVVVVDLPGHGKSGCPEGFGYTMPGLADLVVQVMDELKIEKATVAGSSMGGAVTAWVAIRHPDRVDRLILVDAAGTGIQNNLMKMAGHLMTPSTVIPLIHLVFPVNEKRQAAVPVSERKRVVLAEELYASGRKKCAALALARTMKSISKDVVDDRLAAVTAPTLVIWGSDDGLLPRAAGEFYRDHIPGATMVIVPGGNHTPMQWQPDEFLRVVNEFMAE